MEILKTKLCIPEFGNEMLSRPALVERLESGLQKAGAWALVSAPAGFGKTTLLSEWVAVSGLPVAWVSLDERDNAPVRFWSHIAAAFQTLPKLRGLGVGEVLQTALAAESPISVAQVPPPDLLLVGLVNELADAGVSCVLVLDDYHVISTKEIHDGIRFLLENLPVNVHLILAGRSDPAWSIARMRARGRLLELRAADLRFTVEETDAFLRTVFSLPLSPHDLRVLDRRTEGWVAGLQMAGLSLQSHHDPVAFIESFGGSHRFVLDYLIEEVLARQPERVREFLLRTSVLDRLTPSLCDAVTGISDSRAVLDYLERANLFIVPLDTERVWYRYHHLFADLLRHRLAVTHPEWSTSLHTSACRWYGRHGLVADAVTHAMAAGDTDLAAELVEGCVLPMIEEGRLADLAQLLRDLPDDVLCARPWLCIGYAWTLANTGAQDGVAPLLARAGILGIDGDGDPQLAGYVALVQAYVALMRDDFADAAHLAQDALEHHPESLADLRGYLASILSVALRWDGKLAEADQASSTALTLARQNHDERIVVSLLCDRIALLITLGKLTLATGLCREASALADTYQHRTGRLLPAKGRVLEFSSVLSLVRHDVVLAIQQAREGVDLCKQWGQPDFLASGYCALARALCAAGDVAAADAAFAHAQQLSQRLSPDFHAYLEALVAEFKLRMGQVAWTERWAEDYKSPAATGVDFVERSAYMTLARLRIAQGRVRDALGILSRLLSVVEAAGAGFDVIRVRVLQAVAWLAAGQSELALHSFQQALALAEPEGHIHVFVSEGPPVRSMLRLIGDGDLGSAYVRRLLAVFEASSVGRIPMPLGGNGGFVESLSPRELQVLQLVATGMSNREIAQTLVIATNTVKNHLKAIYGKLDVHSRTAAVDAARHADLI